MKNMKKEMNDLKLSVGLAWKEPCTPEENKQYEIMSIDSIPEDIYINDMGVAKKYQEPTLSPEEKAEFYTLKQLAYLKSIKNSLKFFVALTIISFVVGAIVVMAGGSFIGDVLRNL